MQLTFLLGNGFDSANGMHTGYPCFYNWYLKQPDTSDDEGKMKASIRDDMIDTWADFELALGQYTKQFSDVERFVKCFTFARNALIRYLNEEYNRVLAENKDFLKSATYRLIELSQNANRDILKEQANCFTISAHIPMEFNCISFNYTPILQDGYEDIMQNAIGISNRDNWRDKYYIGEMLNVHGTLRDTPILGVDHVGQIANETFRTNPEIIGMMVKGEIDRKLGLGWREKATQIIRNSDKIYVFGASIGDTDEFWWRTLAQWFEADPDQHQLAIFCNPKNDKAKMQEKVERMVGNISKHFVDKNYQRKIAIDSTAKTMTVQFAYLSANSTGSIQTKAEISVVPAKSISLSGG